MESYKVTAEKALRVLYCLTPPLIFINGPPKVGKTTFAKKLAAEGFSIFTIPSVNGVAEAKKYLQRNYLGKKPQNPIILEGWIENADDINKIFDGVPTYSYVYIYPNNAKDYWQRVTSGDSKRTNEVKTLLQKQKTIYQQHLEEYEEKILTVLV
jgi:adenylate kinase family enzyme